MIVVVAVGLTIGGEVCIGPIDKCENNDKGVISAKAYVGVQIVEATAFFYASLNKTSLAGIIANIAPSAQVPAFLGKVEVTGYDIAACNSGDHPDECKAVISFCTMPGGKTLEDLKPPLFIPFGFFLSDQLCSLMSL